jgi:hypothetical protein
MTNMMTLYRVEDEHGRGPYRIYNHPEALRLSRDHSDWYLGTHYPEESTEVSYLHPGPDEDPGLGTRYDVNRHAYFQFAFSSLDQLKRWFRDDLVALTTLNCHVAVLSAVQRSTLCGAYQAVYNAKRAVVVETLPLAEVLA